MTTTANGSTNSPINPKLAEEKATNRKKLLDYLEADNFFSNPVRQARFKDLCLSLFDDCNCLFSYYQRNILTQVAAFATARNVQIYKSETEGKLAVNFETKAHLLKVTLDVGADTYETDLTSKATGQSVKNEDVYAEDFIEIMDLISVQEVNNQIAILSIELRK